METSPAWPNTCAGCGEKPAGGARLKASSLEYMALHQEQTADLNIVTAEGDKVTLSAEYRAEATLLSYDRSATDGSGHRRVAGEYASFDLERQVSLSVEGDLNEKEMSDIEALLIDLGKMLKGFLTGKRNLHIAQSDRLTEGSSLARVDAVLEYRAQLETASVTAREFVQEGPGFAKSPPVEGASSTALNPAAGFPPPVVTASAEAPPPVGDRSESDRTADRMAQRVRRSGLGPHRLRRLIVHFLRQSMQDMHTRAVIDSDGMRRGEGLVERLLGRLEPTEARGTLAASRVSLQQASVETRFELHLETRPSPIVAQTA